MYNYNAIAVNDFGQIQFRADSVAKVKLPVFDVVELEWDEEINDLDYYAADLETDMERV